MKKILLTVLLSPLFYLSSQAQDFSLRVGLGYAFPQAGQTLDANGYPYSGSFSPSGGGHYSTNKASFSSGAKFSAGLQYMFSKNIGVSVDVNVGIASKKYKIELDSVLSISGNDPSTNTITRYAQTPVIILPSLVLQTGGTMLNVYVRGGLALPAVSKIISEEHDSHLTVMGEQEELNKTIKTKFGIGFAGAMGVSYKASESVNIWLEANMLSMSLYTKEADITSHTIDGSVAPNPPYGGSKVQYVSSGTTNDKQAIAFSVPFSNVGLMVGAGINLGRKKVLHHPHQIE